MTHKLSFCSDFEDFKLATIFCTFREMTYVDIEPNSPISGNFFWLKYGNGWNGINVISNPQRYMEFLELREDDTNLNLAISDKESLAPIRQNIYKHNEVRSITKKKIQQTDEQATIVATTLEVIFDKLKLEDSVDVLSCPLTSAYVQNICSLIATGHKPKIIILAKRNYEYFSLSEKSQISINRLVTKMRECGYTQRHDLSQNLWFVADEFLTIHDRNWNLESYRSQFWNRINENNQIELNSDFDFAERIEQRRLRHIESLYNDLLLSTSWKITKPLRSIKNFFLKLISNY